MQITAGIIAKERGFADADYRAVIREFKETADRQRTGDALYEKKSFAKHRERSA